MKSVGDCLSGLSLPEPAPGPASEYVFPEAYRLGGDLPLGHLHVWGGPPRSGKTGVLLGLLHDAARRGRETLLATYDLPAQSLALRLLAATSGVPLRDLETGRLDPAATVAVARARARLRALPLRLLEARGCSVAALDWHLVRDPRRVEVLGVDAVQGVVRPSGQPLGGAIHDLADLARRRHAAVVVVSQAVSVLEATGPESVDPRAAEEADRVGWIARSAAPEGGEARLLANRHGSRHACSFRYDPATTRWLPR